MLKYFIQTVSIVFLTFVIAVFFTHKNLWPADKLTYLIAAVETEWQSKANRLDSAKNQEESEAGTQLSSTERKVHRFNGKTGIWAGSRPESFSSDFILHTLSRNIFLINKSGKRLHSWTLPDKYNYKAFIQGIYLFPDGNLLINIFGFESQPAGKQLVLLDKNSEILWERNQPSHHDLHVDDNKVYVVEHNLKSISQDIFPCKGFTLMHESGKYHDDQITILDLQGKPVDSFSVLESICKSNFKGLMSASLYQYDMEVSTWEKPVFVRLDKSEYAHGLDPIHANSVYVITNEDAALLPFANRGDVLVSLRNINAVVLIDRETKLVKWARSGEFVRQHYAKIIDNRYLGIFDNLGDYYESRSSRVLLIDLLGEEKTKIFSPAPEFYYAINITGEYEVTSDGSVYMNDWSRLFQLGADNSVIWALNLDVINPGKDLTDNHMLSFEVYPCASLKFITCESN